MMKSMNYYDLLEAFKLTGCPLCRLLNKDADHFLDTLLYEFVADPMIQAEFRKSRGLCNVHAWGLTQQRGGNVGVAILAQAVLDDAIAVLNSASGRKTASPLTRLFGQQSEGSLLAERLEAGERCMCCVALDAHEARYVETLAAASEEERFKEAYAASSGLCLPHFRRLLKVVDQAEARQTLIDIQTSIWQALSAELELFRYKVDPRWTGDPMGAEANSWLRTTEVIAGASSVFPSQRE